MTAIVSAFSFTGWFFEAWAELVRYFWAMDATQYGVVAGCAVAFGFLCLKGTGINR